VDPRTDLAYEAIQKNLASQDGTLSNLRNRAAGLFTATVVVTTFASAAGLISNDPGKGNVLPPAVAIVALLIVVLVGTATMYTMWPVQDWAYGPSGKSILGYIDKGLDEDAIRRRLVDSLATGAQRNARELGRRGVSYRVGVLLLGIEVVVLVLPLALR